MDCELEKIWLEQKDFDCIGQIARHCDWNQLCLYIREQMNLYILPKIGYCLLKVINDNPDEEIVKKLLCGSEFEINGRKEFFFGLKRVLIHASYGSYIFRHGLIDTPFGVVQKINQDSLPANINELRSIKNEHFTNANLYMENFESFLKTISDNSLILECLPNTCSGNKGNVRTQRRQFTFKNVSKDD